MVSFDRSLLKEEAPRLVADFNHPLSYERSFKFPRYLVEPLEIKNIIATSAINIHSAIFKGRGHGHGIGELLLSISYGAIVPIAPFGMPWKYHSAISNGAIDL
jgi:hypothetical protein